MRKCRRLVWKVLGRADAILQQYVARGDSSSRSLFVPAVAAVVVMSLGLAAAELDQQERTLTKTAAAATTTTDVNKKVSNPSQTALRNMRDISLFGMFTKVSGCDDEFAPTPPPPPPLLLAHRLPSVGSQLQQQQEQRRRQLLRSRQTLRKMEQDSSTDRLEDRYTINWDEPLGEGSFGVVYLGFDKHSGDAVAVKKISKAQTGDEALQLEIRALLHLRDSGGHPNICSLRENFSEDDGYYYLILDLVVGGELFDHLVAQGAYSEADAARLVREVASALAFLHGGPGLIHGDLKPENLMLSSTNPSDAVIKIIDFGCAVIMNDDYEDDGISSSSSSSINATTSAAAPVLLHGRTLAYSPPEVLNQSLTSLDPSVDMWALGVILYIMLTGIHPYDLSGQATDEEVATAIVKGKSPPLRNSPITVHLSDSAIDLIDKLMQKDARHRISAGEMLEHPWTRGVTASRDKMVGSDKRLSLYRAYTSGIAEKVFENIISWSDEDDNQNVSRRTSIIERSFRAFDPQRKGYITRRDLHSVRQQEETPSSEVFEPDDTDSSRLSLSGFSDLLAENMINKYFPKGSIIYHEGEVGNAMYFINSGTISVETVGSTAKRGPGDFFGEGALLNPSRTRSATIKCDTPVHAMEISREYFEKYLAKSDSGLLLTLREKDKIRKRNRAKMVLRSQETLVRRDLAAGDILFEKGDSSNSLFLVESGKVHIVEDGKNVFTATPGNVFGEYAVLTGRPRNCSAYCADGCVLMEMSGTDFRKLTETSPDIKATLQELSLRRDFKKAVVLRLQKEFPYDNPREAFDAVKIGSSDELDFEAVRSLMRELNPGYSDDEISEMMRTLNLVNSGAVTFEEFEKVFVADIRKSASI